jgi:hypothetical protein
MSNRFRSFALLVIVAWLATVGTALAQDLTGLWRGVMATPWGQSMATEVIFFRNGTYTAAAQMGTLQTRHWGNYRFGGNWIHFDLHGWQPRQHCAHLGCVTLAWPNSETWHLTYFDGRLLRTPNGVLQRVQ